MPIELYKPLRQSGQQQVEMDALLRLSHAVQYIAKVVGDLEKTDEEAPPPTPRPGTPAADAIGPHVLARSIAHLSNQRDPIRVR